MFRRPSLEDPAVGGKARSLARLAALGLPVPASFAIVSTAAAPVLEVRGPGPPGALRTAADVAALDEARAAVVGAPLSPAFARALPRILDALAAPGAGAATFSVRSSSALEDGAEAAAPGVFESALRVPRDQVAGAVRAVLASALSPAAWAYARAAGTEARGAIAVLLHRFVPGDAQGAVTGEPVPGGAAARVQLDVQAGTPGPAARATIEAAARRVAAQDGPVELEWTASGDAVTFLQVRPFRRGRSGAARAAPDAADGWRWDAAHNPAPLSPAQAGLVAWVDARCALGFRQRVRDGYLFSRSERAAPPPPEAPRVLFERLQAEVGAALAALGPAPPLRDALDMYTRGYQGLFGAVQPACAAARAALRELLAAHAPSALDPSAWAALVEAGVASAATRRRAAAQAIAAAPEPAARQAAIAAYLAAFGDESGRWDVAEPTLRETPEKLLFLGAAAGVAGAPETSRRRATPAEPAALAPSLSAADRPRLAARLGAAREAAAVGEDDDALFARLQAAVRAALLALGRSLVAAGRLTAADDVFFLPFDVTLALAGAGSGPSPAADLVALAAAGRAAVTAAADRAPSPPGATAGAAVVTGQRGAGGRAIGRVVLHPALQPPHPGGGPAVLVAATLLPTELPLLDAVALVVETGTPLGHVAAQARERGIPAVVGASGARAALRDGQLVLVDGDRGAVIALDGP